MSSISMAPAFAPVQRRVPAARAEVRLTRRGRFLVAAGFLALIAVLMISLGAMASAGNNEAGGSGVATQTVVVQPGQTLTDLAREVGGSGDIRDTIARIQQLNSLSSAHLQVGQRIALPAAS